MADLYEPIEQSGVYGVQWIPKDRHQVWKMIAWLIQADADFSLEENDGQVVIDMPTLPDLLPGEWLYRESPLHGFKIATDAWFKGKYRKVEP